MIKVDGFLVKQDHFGDGTLKCEEPYIKEDGICEILWCYDSDAELFTLITLRDYIRDNRPNKQVKLVMPYIPHARQDRCVSSRLFTLKSFAKVINSLDFISVEVYDPHSDVSTALIDRINYRFSAFEDRWPEGYVPMFPDHGAAKKYGFGFEIIGNKHRNQEGRIDSYELFNFKEGTKNVLIRDDVCSYGGTYVAAAKELRKRGVEKIILEVTHCENNILKGEVFDWIDEVWTTDSIFTENHDKIKIKKYFREDK